MGNSLRRLCTKEDRVSDEECRRDVFNRYRCLYGFNQRRNGNFRYNKWIWVHQGSMTRGQMKPFTDDTPIYRDRHGMYEQMVLDHMEEWYSDNNEYRKDI